MTEIRFTYSMHKTLEAAERSLEDMYACGDVCEAERPRIERKRGVSGRTYWCVTLPIE